MNIPRYWKQAFKHVEGVRFQHDHFRSQEDNAADIYAWGHSDVSEQEALARAYERIDQIVAALSSPFDENFYYPLSVLREEVLEEIDLSTDHRAVVTRNRYFARVLNSDGMMFVDIDVPTFDLRPAGLWQIIFGKRLEVEKRNANETRKRFDDALNAVERFVRRGSEVGFRVYRTFGGFRLVASHMTFDPNSSETQRIFDALGTDPLYQKLCQSQACFRARLTPKHWRMDTDLGTSPAIRFRLSESMLANPSDFNEQNVRDYDQWVDSYERQHTAHATCQFIKQVGNPDVARELEPLISYHDEQTQAYSGKPLA